MDKKQLNLEVILCRPLVKKAKVFLIRKLLRQVKILRSCKNEELKEKKLRKARRLIAEVHAIKALRPDYVTKFALVTENYVFSGSNTKLKRKRNACAKLAEQWNLMAKINAIRNKFTNWREQLPPMLEKQKKVRKEVGNGSGGKDDEGSEKCSEDEDANESDEKEGEEEEEIEEQQEEDENDEEEGKEEKKNSDSKVKDRLLVGEEESDDEKPELPNQITVKNSPTVKVPKPKKGVKKKKKGGGLAKNEVEKCEEEPVNEETNQEEKMDDPFFIGKKIIVPKLLQKGNENEPEGEKVKRWREDMREEWRPGKRKKNPAEEGKKQQSLTTDDDLHPSWKAKKMQTLKPFQGKKIIFN